MQVTIITPEATLFSGEAAQVSVPGTLGDFGVLPGHAPFISSLRPGVITVESGEATRKIAVIGGIAEVTPDHCNLLVESALDITAYTATESQALLASSRETLEASTDEAQRSVAEKKLAMAEAVTLVA